MNSLLVVMIPGSKRAAEEETQEVKPIQVWLMKVAPGEGQGGVSCQD